MEKTKGVKSGTAAHTSVSVKVLVGNGKEGESQIKIQIQNVAHFLFISIP